MSGSLVLMMEVSVRTHHCLGFTFFRDSTLLQFTVDELFHCTASKNTPPCETVALPAIKVFHHWSTWSRWHSCESRLRSSQVPLLTHSMCNPSSSEIKSMVFFSESMGPADENFSDLLWSMCVCKTNVQLFSQVGYPQFHPFLLDLGRRAIPSPYSQVSASLFKISQLFVQLRE